MKKITIENYTYDIPESWDDVNVQQYCNFAVETQMKQTGESPYTEILRFISALCGIPINRIRSADISTFNELSAAVSFITMPPDDTTCKLKIEMPEGSGQWFDVCDSLDRSTQVGQFLDLEGWVHRNGNDTIKRLRNMPELLAYMTSIEDIAYTSEDNINQTYERAVLIKTQPIRIFLPVFNFFLQRESALLKNTPQYLEEQANLLRKIAVQTICELKARQKSTVGGSMFTRWWKGISGNLTIYLAEILVRGYLASIMKRTGIYTTNN